MSPWGDSRDYIGSPLEPESVRFIREHHERLGHTVIDVTAKGSRFVQYECISCETKITADRELVDRGQGR